MFCFLAFVLVVVLAGCKASFYQKSADRQVYALVGSAQQQALGRSNAFTINTPYSERDPKTILPSEIAMDRLQTNSRVLSIEDALDIAVKNSRRYQTEKEKLYLAALTLTGVRHEFRPNLFVSSTATSERLSNGEKRGRINSQATLSQTLQTGGSIGVGLVNDLLRYYTGDPRRSAISTFSINFAQPILRAFGKNNPAVENLTQTERNLIYAVRSFSHFQNTYAVEIVNDYFDLLARQDVVRNRYANYLSRVQAARRLEMRAADRERAVDVDQARQAELTARNNYVDSVASYLTALDQFKIKLGIPVGEQVKLDDAPLRELQQRGPVPVALPKDEAYGMAVSNQLEILNVIDQFEDKKRKIRVAASQLKADLVLFGDASLSSEGPNNYTRFDANKWRGNVGLELKLPFDKLRERNDYRAALIDFEAQIRTLALRLDTLKDSIERGLRTLEQRRQNYMIQKSALEVANRRVAGASLSIEAGRGEVRDLVEAQDAQIASQNAVTSALVSYQQALLQLLLDLGVLETESPRFWLKDHLTARFGTLPPPPSPFVTDDQLIPPEKLFGN